MSIPAAMIQTINQYLAILCERKIPPSVRNRSRLVQKWRGTQVTLLEQRRFWKTPTLWAENAIAQFRFDANRNDWSLHWRDRNHRWHPYEGLAGPRSINRLLAEVDQDPKGIFWG
jgi:hypothetical protein